MHCDPRSVLSTCAVEKATWKKFRLERDLNPWPYDTGAMLYPLNYQATWIDGQLWVCHISDDSDYIWIWIYENHICELRISMSEIVILFFSGCFFNCLSWKHTARITISLMCIHNHNLYHTRGRFIVSILESGRFTENTLEFLLKIFLHLLTL